MNLPEWISVKERKPKKGQRVVVCSVHRNGVYHLTMARRYSGCRFLRDEDGFVPTEIISCVKYWQPASGWIEKDTKCAKNE